MPLLDIRKRALKFLSGLEAKQSGQISAAILDLAANPFPKDSSELHGYAGLRRKDVGEYRVIYWYDLEEESEPPVDTVRVILIGKRNGDEVYDQLRLAFEGKPPTVARLIDKFR